MIGLKAFLFWRKVPDAMTPLCRCGRELETVDHILLRCSILEEQRTRLRAALIHLGQPLHTRRDLAAATERAPTARIAVRWLLETGRLTKFRLAERLARAQKALGADADAV